MKFKYEIHKLRLDRGRMWYTMFNSIITAILVYVFSSQVGFFYKLLSGILAFGLIYLFGYIDDRLKLLEREQKKYSDRNPYFEEMNNKLDLIIKNLKK